MCGGSKVGSGVVEVLLSLFIDFSLYNYSLLTDIQLDKEVDQNLFHFFGRSLFLVPPLSIFLTTPSYIEFGFESNKKNVLSTRGQFHMRGQVDMISFSFSGALLLLHHTVADVKTCNFRVTNHFLKP